MTKNRISPNYIEILSAIYIIVTLAIMAVFLFASTPNADEYIGLYGAASWGVLLATPIAAVLIINTIVRLVLKK